MASLLQLAYLMLQMFICLLHELITVDKPEATLPEDTIKAASMLPNVIAETDLISSSARSKPDFAIDSNEVYVVKPDIKFLAAAFPRRHGVNVSHLKATNIGLYSTAGRKHNKIIYSIIASYVGDTKVLTLTDMTACIGSSAIWLARLFAKVNAIEIDATTVGVLRHNVKTFKLKNIDIYHADSTKIISDLEQDVIFVDPPWSGPDYKQESSLNLGLGETDIADLIIENAARAKYFVIRVPFNYNFDKFFSIVNPYQMEVNVHSIRSRRQGQQIHTSFIIVVKTGMLHNQGC